MSATPAKPLIKVCGLTRQADVQQVEAAGFDFAGFIFATRSPRAISPEQAQNLISYRVRRVGVFTDTPVHAISGIMDAARLDYAQLHGPYSPEDCEAIGPQRVIRVLWPESYANPQVFAADIARFNPCAAMFVLDAGTEGGGSGKLADWGLAAQTAFSKPALLAGGIGPFNARAAWHTVRGTLAGLDVNSGVEDAPGCKSERLLRALAELMHA